MSAPLRVGDPVTDPSRTCFGVVIGIVPDPPRGIVLFQNKAHDVAPVGVLVRYRDAFIQGQAS